MLMQHGAESALVESTARRLGLALGADNVEVAIMANAIIVTAAADGVSVTTVRRNRDRGINVHIVTEVQKVMHAAEAGELDMAEVSRRLDAIEPQRYPRWLVVIAVGLACGCFARLAGADATGCGLAVAASAAAMATRQFVAAFHFNPLVTFFAAAFVATSISAQGVIYGLGAKPTLAMAASVLLLVPGFPLINGMADMVKGYANTGIARITMATLLAMAASAGILLAMNLWKVWAWL